MSEAIINQTREGWEEMRAMQQERVKKAEAELARVNPDNKKALHEAETWLRMNRLSLETIERQMRRKGYLPAEKC